jgi:hypothetical protein
VSLFTVGARIVGFAGSGGGGVLLPDFPVPIETDDPLLKPNYSVGPGGKDRYRPWLMTVAEGVPLFANGWDAPWLWDRNDGAFYDLGWTQPTGFAFASFVNPGTGYLEDGGTRTYHIVERDSVLGRETSAQIITVTNNTGQTQDVQLSAPASTQNPSFDTFRIYRTTEGDGTPWLVADVPPGSWPYTDTATDDSIRGGTFIVQRNSVVPPPRFVGLATYLSRTFGWTGDDSNLYYTQGARADGEFVLDDFYPVPIQIGPVDNFGAIVACVPSYTSLIVFKKRAAYEVSEEGINEDGSPIFSARLLFDDRGCISSRGFVSVDNFWVFLDERGLMLWTPGAEPVTAGAGTTTRESPLAPLWRRMNRDAAHLMYVVHNEKAGTVEAHIALDDEPVCSHRIVYDYRQNRYVSDDSAVWGFASGVQEDAAGREHRCRLDELGYVWEEELGNSEGAYEGDLKGPIASVNGYTVGYTVGGFDLTKDGIVASPFDTYDSNGEVVGVNRVARVIDASTIERLYLDAAVVGNQSAFGVIPAVAEVPETRSTERVYVSRVFVDHLIGQTDEVLSLDTKADGSAYQLKRSIPLDENLGHSLVPVEDQGFSWGMRISQRFPGMDFSVQAIYVELKPRRARKK